MPNITLPREHMIDLLEDDDVIEDKIIGQSRWATRHQIIFEHENKTYRAQYQVGATEMQDECPWDDVEEVICTEVEPYQVMVTRYRDIP